MAVVHCQEVTGRDGSQDIDERKRYTRTWQLLCDDPNDTAATVKEHVELPDYGDPHPGDPDAFCVEIRASQTDGENHQNWQAVCEYVGRGDPTFEPPEVDFTEESWQEVRQKDMIGDLVANAAGDPYEAGMTRERKRGVLVITRNRLTFSPAVANALRNTVNQDPILVDRYPGEFLAEECKLDSMTAKAVWLEDQSDIHYYRVTLRIATDPDGWQAEYLNAGFNHLVNVPLFGPKPVKIIMPNGTTPSTPQPLNADGTWPLVGDPNYLTFIKHVPTDWAPIADLLDF